MSLLSVICNNSTHHRVGNPKSFPTQTGYIPHKQKERVSEEGSGL